MDSKVIDDVVADDPRIRDVLSPRLQRVRSPKDVNDVGKVDGRGIIEKTPRPAVAVRKLVVDLGNDLVSVAIRVGVGTGIIDCTRGVWVRPKRKKLQCHWIESACRYRVVGKGLPGQWIVDGRGKTP